MLFFPTFAGPRQGSKLNSPGWSVFAEPGVEMDALHDPEGVESQSHPPHPSNSPIHHLDLAPAQFFQQLTRPAHIELPVASFNRNKKTVIGKTRKLIAL